MKRPSAAALKKVTAENLAGLGAERLAEILVSVAETRPDLKRRLRMELAAEQGAEHLVAEIDRRLASLQKSRGKVSWRQRPAFTRDLDALRGLIGERLAALEPDAALDRMWSFLALRRAVDARVRDREGEVAATFRRAAGDLGRLLAPRDPALSAHELVEAFAAQASAWTDWLPALLEALPERLTAAVLERALARPSAPVGWQTLVRRLAEAAGALDVLPATYTDAALKTAEVATTLAHRYLAAGRVAEAGELLAAAEPRSGPFSLRRPEVDFDWESTWIDYLDASGDAAAAQARRWASFERTLSVERAKAFAARLADFEDVEAADRAIAYAAGHPDFPKALAFLMAWPAPAEAARMILARPDDIRLDEADAETWAAKLRGRHPAAAHLLLRKASAAAFRRRDFKACERLTQEAESIALP